MRAKGCQPASSAGGERLLDESTPAAFAAASKRSRSGRAPRLVGIGDEPRMGDGGADGGEPRLVAIAAKLELEQGIARSVACAGRHLLKGGQARW